MKNKNNKINRRDFAKLCLKGFIGLSAFLAGCTDLVRTPLNLTCEPDQNNSENGDYDYIVVGSSAGGGPLAANLARNGHKVLLVEAGGDEENDNYRIPLFHPFASEDPAMRWDFFVRHFKDKAKSLKDSKFSPEFDGVFYPRCSTLGGCTAHNAMILVYPHNEDWDEIAKITDDASWNSEHMRTYFERMENCQYAKNTGFNRARHGFKGWLPTSLPSLDTLLGVIRDQQLRDVILGSVLTALKKNVGKPIELLKARFDPNDWNSVKSHSEGLCAVPLTTYQGKRAGPREYIKAVEQQCNGLLTVKLNTLVTKVILEDANAEGQQPGRKKAVGIEYLEGKRLYRADRQPSTPSESPKKGIIRARREVILSGGAFNTPQLLMLSGIGPECHLNEMGIPVQVNLPGVGENLQDRYEVAVITEMKKEFSMLKGMSFKIPPPGDESNRFYNEWQEGKGVFTTNGAVISFIKKSTPQQKDPDLFIFGLWIFPLINAINDVKSKS